MILNLEIYVYTIEINIQAKNDYYYYYYYYYRDHLQILYLKVKQNVRINFRLISLRLSHFKVQIY